MIFALTLIFFCFGLIIGSFLNVVIFRINTSKSLGGRSACMNCSKKLLWHELIPVFSFIGLRGRCSVCKSKISAQYPIVELLSGMIFALLFWKFQDVFLLDTLTFTFTYAYYTLLFSILLTISVYDFRHKIIPDNLSLIFGVLAFIGLFFFLDFNLGFYLPGLWNFLAGPIIALPLALMWLLSGGTWMGLGDAKLALGLGWLLGFNFIFFGFLLSFWSGAILGSALIIFTRKYRIKSEIPFAPFLVLGTFLAFLFEFRIF
ncbi:MAG: prepilin peptidase [Candidatus Paceibacterota bacterium]